MFRSKLLILPTNFGIQINKTYKRVIVLICGVDDDKNIFQWWLIILNFIMDLLKNDLKAHKKNNDLWRSRKISQVMEPIMKTSHGQIASHFTASFVTFDAKLARWWIKLCYNSFIHMYANAYSLQLAFRLIIPVVV